MNRQLVIDLVNAINDKRVCAIDHAVDLLDNPDEIRVVLFAVVASDICALIDALADQDELHPLFARLPRPLQTVGVMSVLSTLVLEGHKSPQPNAQSLFDVTEAVREINAAVTFSWQ